MASHQHSGMSLPFEHSQPSPKDWRRLIVSLPVILLLHLLIFLLLAAGIRLPPLGAPKEKPVEITFQEQKQERPQALALPKLVAPERSDVSPPSIDVAAPPLSATQSITPSRADAGTTGSPTASHDSQGQGSAAGPARAAPRYVVDPNYLAILQRYIVRHAKDDHISAQGTVLLRLTLDGQGHLLALSVAQSSGSERLDDDAMAMVRRSEPLPPPPADWPQAGFSVLMPVHYRDLHVIPAFPF